MPPPLSSSPKPNAVQPNTDQPSGALAHFLAHPRASEARLLHHALRTLREVGHLAVVVAVLVVILLIAGETRRAVRVAGGRFIAIAPPIEPNPSGGLALWQMLAPLLTGRSSVFGRRPPVSFEYHADANGLRIGLWVSGTLSAPAVAQAVEAAWPGARATITDTVPTVGTGDLSAGVARLSNPDWLPLSADTGTDPLRGVLAALVGSHDDETATLMVLARPARTAKVTRARRAARAIRRGEPGGTVPRLLDLFTNRAPTRPSTSSDPLALLDTRAITDKTSAAPHFEVAVRYVVTGGTGRDGRRRRRGLLCQITTGLGLYTGRNHFVGRFVAHPARVLDRHRLRRGFLASCPELAALAHLPAEPAGYGLPAPPARQIAPPPEVAHV